VTKSTARAVANVVMVTAGLAAAFAIVTTPPLRRLVSIAARRWLGAGVPVYLLSETHRAWVESGRRA